MNAILSLLILLGLSGSANCYIVPAAGEYAFPCVKGCSDESVGAVADARLMWQTADALIEDVSYSDGQIHFSTPAPFACGNALVAALDRRGKVLWSWHLWLTPPPGEREYAQGAGVAMDRNLGATSTAFLEEGSEGLKYQWGRKDPFAPGLYDTVLSDRKHGTEQYAREHPASFICGNAINRDWLYPGEESAVSPNGGKSISDPCPPGWKLPCSDFWKQSGECGVYGSDQTGIILVAGPREALPGLTEVGVSESDASGWYPAAGYLDWTDGSEQGSGVYGFYLTDASVGEFCSQLYFFRTGYCNLQRPTFRAYGQSVRCIKE